LSVVCCLLSVVCCLLSVVCCLLSVVCCLLSIVHQPMTDDRGTLQPCRGLLLRAQSGPVQASVALCHDVGLVCESTVTVILQMLPGCALETAGAVAARCAVDRHARRSLQCRGHRPGHGQRRDPDHCRGTGRRRWQ
jgi:hypothetical protein